MTKDEELFFRHLTDRSELAWNRGIVTFSDFCSLNELNIYHRNRDRFSVRGELSGGYVGAERQMIAFIPDALSYDWTFPISALRILPQNPKFADLLTHRDYLGSLMNLGVDRKTIGDICVLENLAYVFCEDSMAQYLSENLTRVRHTSVRSEIVPDGELSYSPKTEEITGSIASIRLDSIISLTYRLSRSAASGLISEGKVFLNGALVSSGSRELEEGDLVSVRGYGKFRFEEIGGQSRKGRLFARIAKFV